MAIVKLQRGEIIPGERLPWSLFDQDGRLLLEQGQVIRSVDSLDLLYMKGVYRYDEGNSGSDVSLSPFATFTDYYQTLDRISTALTYRKAGTVERLMKLCSSLQGFIHRDMDVSLALVHLDQPYHYGILHSLHTAVLSEIIGAGLNVPAGERLSLIAAALTANLSFYDLQDRLREQKLPLNAAQKSAIEQHPLESVGMLQANEVGDEKWLNAVRQHHERLDGDGYPDGLAGEQIDLFARIIAVADHYSASVTRREYRDTVLSKDALRWFFIEKGSQYDEACCLYLIKELGIYPPGIFVRLENKEVAIVTRRQPDSTLQPIVKSISSGSGEVYTKPQTRDTTQADFSIKAIIRYKMPTTIQPSLLWATT